MPDGVAIAIDLGTTTIAASLMEIRSGRQLAKSGGLNPQRVFGADIISRLEAARGSSANRQRLSAIVNGALAELVEELFLKTNLEMNVLRGVAIAGNPAMEHLLLGLPVDSLTAPPYRPLFAEGRLISAKDLGWGMNLPVYIFPLPGGFVGGDLVAFLYGQGIDSSKLGAQGSRLFLDLGTNGEIALVCGGKVYATSAAAGPAFEGGNLSCGMAALPGAISDVAFLDNDLRLETIGDISPTGICGSGVIAAIAGMRRAGVIDHAGTLLPLEKITTNIAMRVQERECGRVFSLYRDAKEEVFISQEDIRQVQLAKAAIRAGIEVLAARSSISLDAVDEIVITGSFGAELVPEQLKTIGIFPENMVQRPGFVREGTLRGVEKTILADSSHADVEELASLIKVVPLSGTPAFEKHFLESMNFI